MLQNDIQVYAPKSYLNAPQYSLGNNKFKLVENEQVLTQEDQGTSCVTQHPQILFRLKISETFGFVPSSKLPRRARR